MTEATEIVTNGGGEPTPMVLLREAMAAGNTELARDLMALVREWKQDRAKELFHAAWARAWPKMPIIMKTKKVKYKTSGGYKYAQLPDVIDAVRPVLEAEHLSLAHEVSNNLQENTVTVVCILGHEAGYERRNTVTLPINLEDQMGPQQKFGSAMTYAQRYSTMTALGLAAADDTDATDLIVNKDDPLITDKQLAELDKLFAQADKPDVSKQAALRLCKVERFADLRLADYTDLLESLKMKLKLKAAKR